MQYTTETNLENILAKFGSEAVAYKSTSGKEAFVFPIDSGESKEKKWEKLMYTANKIAAEFKKNGGTIFDVQEILEAGDDEMKNLFGDDWKIHKI